MNKDERDSLARNIQKLLRATYASPDPDGLMAKLRSALDGLVALAVTTEAPPVDAASSKRPLAASDDDTEGIEHEPKQQHFIFLIELMFPRITLDFFHF